MIGINIGSLNTIYSRCEKNNNLFSSKILLSEVSNRVIPSILSYTDTQRITGDISKNSLKKFSNSSFIYLSRLIGLIPDTNFGKKELEYYYYIGPKLNKVSGQFDLEFNNNKISVFSDDVVAAFLDKLNTFYFFDSQITFEFFIISVPDYFTSFQIDTFKTILRSLTMEPFEIITESTAITLYYGYTKFKNIFEEKEGILNKNTKKFIIFIDAGHSKTTFILSEFAFTEFKVLNVKCLPYLGGRDFDEKIRDYLIYQFEQKYKIPFPRQNAKLKYRMMTEIIKARKILTSNKDVVINIDSLYDENDLNEKLTREEFEKLINDDLILFENNLKDFYNESLNIIGKNNSISLIEMAGDLMRTPVLQNLVKKVTNFDLSKGIIIDECPALGASLYGAYINDKFPLPNFEGIASFCMYSIIYSTNQKNNSMVYLIKKGQLLPSEKIIEIDYETLISEEVISFEFYNDMKEIEEFSIYDYLVQYKVHLNKLFNANCKKIPNGSKINFVINIDQNGTISPLKFVSVNNNIELNISDDIITSPLNGLYKGQDYEENIIKDLTKILDEHRNVDVKFNDYCNEKNEIEGRFYNLKNRLNSKNLDSVDRMGKTLKERFKAIEVKIENVDQEEPDSKIKRLFSIKNRIKQIENELNIGK